MSSACQCHVEGEFCFYCEVYSPVVAENERLKAELAVVEYRVCHEMMGRVRGLAQENERLYAAIAAQQTLYLTETNRLEADVAFLRMQRDSLEATLQHYRGYA